MPGCGDGEGRRALWGMALTEDDGALVRKLLAENGAEWIAEQVDVDLTSAQETQIDPTIDATSRHSLPTFVGRRD